MRAEGEEDAGGKRRAERRWAVVDGVIEVMVRGKTAGADCERVCTTLSRVRARI